MIEIIKNVPIPQRGVGARIKHQDLYDLVEMWEVGDSVVFDFDRKNESGRGISSRASSLTVIAKRANQKITVRRNEENSAIQVWRVE
jgi:hypothetical protein